MARRSPRPEATQEKMLTPLKERREQCDQPLWVADYQRWRDLRAHLQHCEETRRQQFRFCKDPAAYLAALEAQLLT